ncbi:hypothetical protein Tco_0002133 [Tanacetum coccineum]
MKHHRSVSVPKNVNVPKSVDPDIDNESGRHAKAQSNPEPDPIANTIAQKAICARSWSRYKYPSAHEEKGWLSQLVNERRMQTTEGKVDTSKTLDASLVDTESSDTELGEHDTNNISRNDAHVDDVHIKPIYDEEPMAEGNEAKVKKDIDDFEIINIELEHSVAKLLTENEHLNKENDHLKKTYKDLYDPIKKTRVQTKDHNDSLIEQLNKKSIENANLKAQIQEKVFANATLKNKLRKIKGTSVDTKFAKPSILGKPILHPLRNQSVVRQPNAFKSERPKSLKPRFTFQVDVKNDLSKPVTPH